MSTAGAEEVDPRGDQFISLGVSVVKYINKYKSSAWVRLKSKFKNNSRKLWLNEERGELEIESQEEVSGEDIVEDLEVGHLHTDSHLLSDPGAVKHIGQPEVIEQLNKLEARYTCAIYVEVGPPKSATARSPLSPPPKVHSYMIGQLKVYLQGGEITRLKKGDVFVNELPLHGHVGHSTLEPALTKACQGPVQLIKQIEKQRRKHPDDLAKTDSFELVPFSAIYHFNLDKYERRAGEIVKVVYQVLIQAEEKQASSVVYPAIGCYKKGYPPKESAEEMYTALKMFVPSDGSSLESITVWIPDEDVLLIFRQVFNDFWLEGVPIDKLERYIPRDTTDAHGNSMFAKYAPQIVQDMVSAVLQRKAEIAEKDKQKKEIEEKEKEKRKIEEKEKLKRKVEEKVKETKKTEKKCKKSELKKATENSNAAVEEVKSSEDRPAEDIPVVEQIDKFKFVKEKMVDNSIATIYVTADSEEDLSAVLSEVQKLMSHREVEKRIQYPPQGLSDDVERKIWILCNQHRIFNMPDRKSGFWIIRGNEDSVSTLADQINELMLVTGDT